MRWRERGAVNSQPLKKTRPRVSLIVAIFSTGEVYYCVSLSNTNADTFLLWLTKLTQRLDTDRPGWASTVLFTLDGAKYHRTAPVREQMAGLGMRVAISGPYQYDVAPVELYFAQLKQTYWNKEAMKTGKKTFLNTLRIVKERTEQIKPANVVMLFHRAVLKAFEQLTFKHI